MATTNTTKKAGSKPAKPEKKPTEAKRVAEKPSASKSSVIKRPYSLPVPLFKFALAEAKRIAKQDGKKRPNVSGYIASLIFAAKHAAATTPAK